MSCYSISNILNLVKRKCTLDSVRKFIQVNETH